SSRRRHTSSKRDWSSDVCSSDLMNPFLWFLIAIIIPILFALILAYIIFSMAGVNVSSWVKDKASTIPVVSSMIITDEEKSLEHRSEDRRVGKEYRNW